MKLHENDLGTDPVFDCDSERDFGDWLDSIELVDENGKVIPTMLLPDESEDVEGDRA